MKEFYKISEISKLYGIGIDSLRYYEEIGVLRPRRDTNGYRLYGLKDIYRLNLIRNLRQLGFTMKQIKAYLDNQSITNTLDLLREEQSIIQAQLKALRDSEQTIRHRISALQNAAQTPTGIFAVKTFPARPCVRLSALITRDEEMDFVIRKLHRKHESRLHDFGSLTIGASLSSEDLKKGIFNVFHSVFFILEPETREHDFLLPAGQYLSYFYRGDYRQAPERIREVQHYVQKAELRMMGDLFEIYEIDNRDTIRPKEFLTEIQVRIAKKKSGES